MVVMLKDINFNQFSSELDLPWRLDGSGRGPAFRSSNWDSPRFKDQSELLLMEFLGPDFLDWDGCSPLPKLSKTEIKKQVIHSLILSYRPRRALEYTRQLGRDQCSHLMFRHSKYEASSDVALAHFNALPSNIPPFLVSHYIKLLCGATNYDGGRRRKFAPNGSVHPEKSAANPFPCYLCSTGSVDLPGDNERHIFQSCSVVKSAWLNTVLHPSVPIDNEWVQVFAEKTTPLFIIDFPLEGKNTSYCRLALVMSFAWSIYKTISQIRMGRCALGAGERATSLTLELSNFWLTCKPKVKIKKPG